MKRSRTPARSRLQWRRSAWRHGDPFADRFQLQQRRGLRKTTSQAPGMTHVFNRFELTPDGGESRTFISVQTKPSLFPLHPLWPAWPRRQPWRRLRREPPPLLSPVSPHRTVLPDLLMLPPLWCLAKQHGVTKETSAPCLQKREAQDLHQSTSLNVFQIPLLIYTHSQNTPNTKCVRCDVVKGTAPGLDFISLELKDTNSNLTHWRWLKRSWNRKNSIFCIYIIIFLN